MCAKGATNQNSNTLTKFNTFNECINLSSLCMSHKKLLYCMFQPWPIFLLLLTIHSIQFLGWMHDCLYIFCMHLVSSTKGPSNKKCVFWLMGLLMNDLDTFISNRMIWILNGCDMDLQEKLHCSYMQMLVLKLELSSKFIWYFLKMLNCSLYICFFSMNSRLNLGKILLKIMINYDY